MVCSATTGIWHDTSEHPETTFVGYETLAAEDATVVGLLRDGHPVDEIAGGEGGSVIVDVTPFYSESGGQIGDRGDITGADVKATVHDTHRLAGGLVLHSIEVVSGRLRVDDKVGLQVDAGRRADTIRNHTATHLMHAALRDRLGEHVRQAGSLVAPDRLRFDFSHFAPVEPADIAAVEREVNAAIRADIATDIREMSHPAAIERGALAFFGDKYGDRVRVVTVPGLSMELCGGNHVERTGEIGTFVITKEESVAAGTRRIEAITGAAAFESLQKQRGLLRQVMADLQAGEDELHDHLDSLQQRLKAAERDNEQLRVRIASEATTGEDGEAPVEVDGVSVWCREVEGLDPNGLRSLADSMKAKLGSGVVVLGARSKGKAQLIVGVTADLASKLSAAEVVAALAPMVGGGGGGSREMAQAGGPLVDGLPEALGKAPEVVGGLLG